MLRNMILDRSINKYTFPLFHFLVFTFLFLLLRCIISFHFGPYLLLHYIPANSRHIHGSLVESASNCAPAHSRCVSSERSPITCAARQSTFAMKFMFPGRGSVYPLKHKTQNTVGSGVGAVVGTIAFAGASVGLGELNGSLGQPQTPRAATWRKLHCSSVTPNVGPNWNAFSCACPHVTGAPIKSKRIPVEMKPGGLTSGGTP
mmetsp:Transcript_43847/g.106322  ORF Transcript_43847/g.106322 Transcript_43847/m.106322 type:complete len:203 (+) Transcript_43847:182-790(+)